VNNILQIILSTFLLLPYLVFLLMFYTVYKLTKKPKRAFGVAADITTFFLFLAVPIAIEALFEVKTMIYFFCFGNIDQCDHNHTGLEDKKRNRTCSFTSENLAVFIFTFKCLLYYCFLYWTYIKDHSLLKLTHHKSYVFRS